MGTILSKIAAVLILVAGLCFSFAVFSIPGNIFFLIGLSILIFLVPAIFAHAFWGFDSDYKERRCECHGMNRDCKICDGKGKYYIKD